GYIGAVSIDLAARTWSGLGGSATIVSIEGIAGTQDDDTISGRSAVEYLDGQGGDDALNGRGGEDTLIGGAGDDTIDGGVGNDYLEGGSGFDSIIGGQGDDTIVLSGAEFWISDDDSDGVMDADEVLWSHDGIDNIDGGGGYDTLDLSGLAPAPGYTGAVSIDLAARTWSGLGGSATIEGIERIAGTQDGDTIRGWIAAEYLDGQEGDDTLNGRGGEDTLIGGAGDDMLDGGSGIDTADYSSAAAGVKVGLDRTSPQDTLGAGIDTLVNIERLTGSAHDDTLTGDALANGLDGGAGNDVLDGGTGADTLAGGAGDDFYYVDNAGDFVIELSGEGVDRVQASIDYTLADNVENLTLKGAAVTGTGNELANV